MVVARPYYNICFVVLVEAGREWKDVIGELTKTTKQQAGALTTGSSAYPAVISERAP